MEAGFCVQAVEEALARHGKPEIFNTDQGRQFTSTAFTGLLTDNAIAISMDGRGAWRDNLFVERLWRSVKHEVLWLRLDLTASSLPDRFGVSDRDHAAMSFSFARGSLSRKVCIGVLP